MPLLTVVIEVESKYRSPSNEKVEGALARLGAKKISTVEMEDVDFSHPSRDFGRSDEALRLRKVEGESELTYKGPRMHSESTKAREEITVKVDNPLAVQRIVERLGFKEFCLIRKKRSSYLLDRLRVDVDDVEELGEFVELEVLTESPEKAASLMETARTELELQRHESRTYLEMLLDKHVTEKNKGQ